MSITFLGSINLLAETYTVGVGPKKTIIFKEIRVAKRGDYRVMVRVTEVRNALKVRPTDLPFELRLLGPYRKDRHGRRFVPAKPVAVCRGRGRGSVWFNLSAVGEYRLECTGERYGGIAQVVIEPLVPVEQRTIQLRTDVGAGQMLGGYKGPAYGIPKDHWLDLLYTGSHKNAGGGREDMVLYIRASSPRDGTGWGAGVRPATNRGLREIARFPHAMLFQTAIRKRPMPGVYKMTVGQRLFVLTVTHVGLTHGHPRMPPQWHEFMVTAELRQYDLAQLQLPQPKPVQASQSKTQRTRVNSDEKKLV